MGHSPRQGFSFAVIADSHVNPSDEASSSPWEVNRLANRRLAHAVRELNQYDLAFVVHLGDMVHPVPAWDAYDAAAERFHAISADLDVPLHVVPGNHDVGDKPLAWSPAPAVTEPYLARYERHFGADYYGFDHDGCHFVTMNVQLLNSGLARDQEQRRWLERDLAAHSGERTFVFMHYPPYVTACEEPSSYDNIDEPARSWLLDQLARARVEAVFAGHVHNFFYDRLRSGDLYVAPSLSFVRLDYSEFARIPPADGAFGRDDPEKLGYLLVDVGGVDNGDHGVRVVRTHGATTTEPDARVPPASLRNGPASPVGVDLRHPWAETVDIPYAGGIEEFGRKRARNDYPLLALWEMGIRSLRVPLTDLTDPEPAARARVLAHNGFTFRPFVFGPPAPGALEAAGDLRAAIAFLEVIVSGSAAGQAAMVAGLRSSVPADLPVYVSPLHGHGATDALGRHVHAINHGFRADDPDGLAALTGAGGVQGAVFRVGWDTDVAAELAAIEDATRSLGLAGLAHVRLAGESPACRPGGAPEAACRVADTVVAAYAHPGLHVMLDTFVDHDRGYFPRTGLLDRRYDLRPAGHVVRNLTTLLGSPEESAKLGGTPGCRVLRAGDGLHVLLLPGPAAHVRTLPVGRVPAGSGDGVARVAGLTDDTVRTVSWRPAPDGARLGEPLTVTGPTLVTIEPMPT